MLLDLLRVGQAEDRFVKVHNVLKTSCDSCAISDAAQRCADIKSPPAERPEVQTIGKQARPRDVRLGYPRRLRYGRLFSY